MKNLRRLSAYALIVLGALVLLVGFSPLFPVFLQAFLIGGALLGVGLWILSGRDLRGLLGRAARAARTSRPREGYRDVTPRARPAAAIDPLLPVRVLKLAKAKGGMLSVSDVAIGLEVPIEQAEAGLAACVQAGNALPDYDVARGLMLYRFPEFLGQAEDARR